MKMQNDNDWSGSTSTGQHMRHGYGSLIVEAIALRWLMRNKGPWVVAGLAIAIAASLVFWKHAPRRGPGDTQPELQQAVALCQPYVPHVSNIQDLGLGRVQVTGIIKDTTWTCVTMAGEVDSHHKTVDYHAAR